MVSCNFLWATMALLAMARANPIATAPAGVIQRAQRCNLTSSEPKSWAESGAEKKLGEWLNKHGSDNWLAAISKAETGITNTNSIDCATTSTNDCESIEGSADCDHYEYYFIRTMASQINAAFKEILDQLKTTVIVDSLTVDTIIKDFDILKPPEGQKASDLLSNLALGPSILSAICGMAPGGGVAAGAFALFGAAFTATSQNLKEDEPVKPEYNDLASVMNKRLSTFFSATQDNLKNTLLAIFGDKRLPPKESAELLRGIVAQMSAIGVPNMNKNVPDKLLIAELLKSGEFLQKTQIANAMKKAFATTQHALIGNLLTTLQVYVEQEMPAYNEGLVQPCTALGTLKEGNSCHVIKHRPFNGPRDRVPLDDKYLRLMGDYGIDLHTLIGNVRDCNNGQTDASKIPTDGSYPPCFFGMNFAQKVHQKDWWFQREVADRCLSDYQNQKGVPGWITDNSTHCDYEIPKWKPCKVTFEETSYWTEGGLDRYRISMVGEKIDMAPICPYVFDPQRCDFSSNRQCNFNEETKKWVFDVNFPKGSHGHERYKSCRDELKTKYAKDNRC